MNQMPITLEDHSHADAGASSESDGVSERPDPEQRKKKLMEISGGTINT